MTSMRADEVLSVGRPLALVAEDNVVLRENTVRMLDRRGVAAIPVGSYAQAANALMVSPRVDVALLDLHLDIHKEVKDKGGIAIARLLRSSSAHIRIIGYSGKFRDAELRDDELALFDETKAKGQLSHSDHIELWDKAAAAARESHELRRQAAFSHHDNLRRLYEAEVPEPAILQRLQMDDPPADEFTAEGALGLAGYKVKVVQLRLRGAESRPFLVWEQQMTEDDVLWVNLEVYEHPDLYSAGYTESEALNALAEFISLTQHDILAADEANSWDRHLAQFLETLWAT
jgi:CheY-like chemotaxis protein